MREADLVVVGGGIGGYTCAIRASQLGLKTVLVERSRLGGECLIAGCIPSKAIISVAKAYDKAKQGARFGIHAEGISIDLEALQGWKDSVVRQMETGVAALCHGYKVEVIRGEATLTGRNTVRIAKEGGREDIASKHIVVATGSNTVSLPGLEPDGKAVLSSREALELKALPNRLLVVGGGYIGLEIAGMYQRFGSQVTVVELTDQLLPGTEPDLVRLVQRSLERRGAAIHLRSKVVSIEEGDDGVRTTLETPQGTKEVQADVILLSVGRRPSTGGLGLGQAGVELDAKGFIKTDRQMRTNVASIFAIGDVRGPPLLAHKAEKEGVVAAEAAAGLKTTADWKVIPWAIFTDPEVAGAGMTEKDAAEAGLQVKRTRFPFAALGRAVAAGETEGFVKVVSDAASGLVRGVQIVGPEASDLISEAALAIEMGATVEDLALTMHPHPTLPEAIMEAAESAAGTPIHQLRS